MELRSEFSFATKPSSPPAKVLSADPGPTPGKSGELCETSHIDIPRAVKGEGSSIIKQSLPPRKVAARMELRSEFSFATKPSLIPAKVLSADPGPTPGKSDEPVLPAT